MSKIFGDFKEKPYICKEFPKTCRMTINYRLMMTLYSVILLASATMSAQSPTCVDTAEHKHLLDSMWSACKQDDPKVTYAACWAFQEHAMKDNDDEAYYDAYVCGIMYNIDRMNIRDAYHITQTMKEIMDRKHKDGCEEQYLVPKMLGHVYNTCGNIPGAIEAFKKAIELIKGTRYEADGLSFLYLGLAHIQMNNDLDKALYWIDEDLKELHRHQGEQNYYRGLADAYAIKAIVKFRQRQYDNFNENYELSEEANRKNHQPIGDLFLPYARIYKLLFDGKTDEALKAVDNLASKTEKYLLSCDIYRYIGDDDKAFLTQRELMHRRDSIAGVTIAENLMNQENEIQLIKSQQQASRRMNIVLTVSVFLAFLVIVLMARNLINRRRYQNNLLEKNKALEEANKQVTAADEMKTEFIRSVSHEIRTPLNIINGFTEVLTNQDNTFDPNERHQIASTINDNARQITSLVNKMLALANNSTKDLLKEAENTDVLNICHCVIESMPMVDAEKIKVSFEDQTEGWDHLIFTHSDSLLQMLDDLLENAAKFTEQGYIQLRLSKNDKLCSFTVEDTGCGINKEDAKHIFERFMKVDEFKEGLGLGLAYCHETAQKLGGTLELDTTYKAGCRFVLKLPIQQLKS